VNPEEETDFQSYFDIPENEKKYLDIIIKNIIYKRKKVDIGVLFIEKLVDGKLNLIPSVEEVGDLTSFRANEVIFSKEKIIKNKNELNIWLKNEYIKII
jgi:hypothetical protein